jgi:hypothetical protein
MAAESLNSPTSYHAMLACAEVNVLHHFTQLAVLVMLSTLPHAFDAPCKAVMDVSVAVESLPMQMYAAVS